MIDDSGKMIDDSGKMIDDSGKMIDDSSCNAGFSIAKRKLQFKRTII